jgi:hypothetical protein
MRQVPAYCVYHRSLWSVNVSFKARSTAQQSAQPKTCAIRDCQGTGRLVSGACRKPWQFGRCSVPDKLPTG